MSHDTQVCAHGFRWHVACHACHLEAKVAAVLAEKKRLARVLLDDCREGVADYSPRRINAALELTGDICGRLN